MTSINPRLARVVRDLVDVSRRSGDLPVLSAKASEALQTQVLDKFAGGDYEGGLAALLGLTTNPRSKKSVKDLAASALIALGIDVAQAKETLSAALTSLAKGGETIPTQPIPDLRASPIRASFRGIGFDLDQHTQLTLKKHAHEMARLEASLTEALGAPDRTAGLRALESKLDLAKTPDTILMGMLTAHREDEKWSDVERLYLASPAAFREIPSAKREHALALAQLGKNREARDVLAELVTSGDRSNVTLGVYGRILKDRYDRAKTEGDPKASHFLELSLKAYKMGFRAEYGELYPGVALPVLLEEKGTPDALAESKAIASVVLYNAERRSRFGEKNYWDSAAALEMSCVLGDPAAVGKWLKETVESTSEPWMRAGTAKNLERLARTRGDAAGPELLDAIATLKSIPATARPRVPRTLSAARFDAPNPKEQLMAAITEQSYRVGGRSSKWLSGNYAYSGIAHDMRITPSDVTYFGRIMKSAGIDKIAKPLDAIKAMDELIRKHFGTDNLEDLHSGPHQRYDRVMPGLARFMAASRENSQTNVSADWINGLADCRQHAPAKLMLWEAWKRQRSHVLLERLSDAATVGDAPKVALLKKAMDELTSWEMRILDARVVDSGEDKLREEHTMTILVKRGAATEGGPFSLAEEVRAADAFYHHVYPFGEGVLKAELDGKKLKLTPEGSNVVLEPAPYSADRAAKSLDFGQLLFRGQTVATPGWEREVPVEGIDLKKLHDYVDAQALAAIAAAEAALKPKSLIDA